MSISDAQFAAWLDDSTAQRVALYRFTVNSGGADIVRYVSKKAYGNGSASTPYLAVVSSGLKMVESISLVTAASFSASNIELYNIGGALDAWLDDVWTNQPFDVRLGDVRWPEADFRTVAVGIIEDIDGTKSRDRINIIVCDKLKQLDASVTEAKMGGVAPNPDTVRRLLLGEVHNFTPKLKNPVTLEYEINAVDSERLIEVRTDGRPRSVTENLAAGSFTFREAVGTGLVTCSAQGVKPGGTYTNRIAPLIQYLVTQCGKASTRFTAADLDTANLAAFDAAHPQAVGLDIPERMNVIDACHQLADSVGAQMIPSRAGLLRLIQIVFPTSATTELRPTVQMERSIRLVAQTDVMASVTLGYCRNYTVQANLQTELPDAHKELFAQEWLTVSSAVDTAVQAKYKLDGVTPQQNTCLQDTAEAQGEADRRGAIFKVKRKTYQFEGTPANVLLELGQPVKLFSNRYSLAAGRFGVVTYLALDCDNFHVEVGVTV
jgi:hypothetical protein